MSSRLPLELRVTALWGKARVGVWWWGEIAPQRTLWLLRRHDQGALSELDDWEVLHEHPGRNAGFAAAVSLFAKHMKGTSCEVTGLRRCQVHDTDNPTTHVKTCQRQHPNTPDEMSSLCLAAVWLCWLQRSSVWQDSSALPFQWSALASLLSPIRLSHLLVFLSSSPSSPFPLFSLQHFYDCTKQWISCSQTHSPVSVLFSSLLSLLSHLSFSHLFSSLSFPILSIGGTKTGTVQRLCEFLLPFRAHCGAQFCVRAFSDSRSSTCVTTPIGSRANNCQSFIRHGGGACVIESM